MNKEFARGLAVGLIAAGALGGVASFVINSQEDKIKRYRKMMTILLNVAEALEQHVDPVTIREIMAENEFDVMMLREFGK